MSYNIDELLEEAVKRSASDLHITVALPPVLRITGSLTRFGVEEFTVESAQDTIFSLMNEGQRAKLMEIGELDFSYAVPGIGRFRVNVFRQRKSLAAAIRVIRPTVPAIDELSMPAILKDFALSKNGLFLVTGHTGSGKSTTLAAMMRHINENKSCHMITIEDPIEYIHTHGKSIVNQREVNDDTLGFSNALRAALREDPDVILVGEMRDLETISTAVTASETGHFVMSTLHTSGAIQTIDRIIDVFPPHQQQQIRTQLAMVVTCILSQHLIPRANGDGRVAAIELLIANDAVRNIIREGKTYQLQTVLQTNIKNNMIPMDYSLARLVREGVITQQMGRTYCNDEETYQRYLSVY